MSTMNTMMQINTNKIFREIRKELFKLSTTIITEPCVDNLPKDISTVQVPKHKRFNTDVADFAYLIKAIIKKHNADNLIEVSGFSGLRSANDMLWIRKCKSSTNDLRITFRPAYMNMGTFHKKYWVVHEIHNHSNDSTIRFHYNVSSPNNNCMYYHIMYNQDRYLYPSKLSVRIIPDIDTGILDEATAQHVHDATNDVYKKDGTTIIAEWNDKKRYRKLPRCMKEFEYDML